MRAREVDFNIAHVVMSYIHALGFGRYEVFLIEERTPQGGAFGFIQTVWGRRRAERLADASGQPWVYQ